MTAKELILKLQSVDPDTIILKQDSEWGVIPVRESESGGERVIFSKVSATNTEYRRDYYPPDEDFNEAYTTAFVIE